MEVARSAATEASAWPNPTLSYQREEVEVGSETSVDEFVEVGIPVSLSGRRGLLGEAAHEEAEAASLAADRAAWLLEAEARTAYYGAARARMRLEVLSSARDQLADLVRGARERVEQGDAAAHELIRLELEQSAVERVASDEASALADSRRHLGRLAGHPEAPLDAADDLTLPDPIPGADGERAAPPRTGELDAASRSVRAAELREGAAQRWWIPDLDVTGGIKASRVGREDDVGYVVGVALELPLLDQRGAARARAASELVIATAEQRTLRAEVASDLEIARSRFRTSEERARQLVTSAAPRATALIDQARLRWREGESPTFELVDAWRTFVDVKLEVIERLHEARLAELALATAGGAPLDTK